MKTNDKQYYGRTRRISGGRQDFLSGRTICLYAEQLRMEPGGLSRRMAEAGMSSLKMKRLFFNAKNTGGHENEKLFH